MFGHPALRLLFWLKFVGGLRLQVRKLRRPSSWIFLGIGVLLLGGWIAVMVLGRSVSSAAHLDSDIARFGAEVGLLVLLVLTIVGSFQFRGLYLPKEEIELAFSAPISRSDLVRYRLGTNLFRSLFAALLFGFLTARRMPEPFFAFVGTMLVMLTIPLVGQGTALLLGEGENRFGKLARAAPLKAISVVLGAAVGIGVVALMVSDGGAVREAIGDGDGPIAQAARNPWVRAALAPLTPWSGMITATSAVQFWSWFAVCVGVWILLYQLVVRAKIDFRELSLATSAEVAKRISQARRGGFGASRTRVTAPTGTKGVPWFFGRGPFGAIAWLETTSMARRARGALILSGLVVVFMVIVTNGISAGKSDDAAEAAEKSLVLGTVLISVLGTAYLCAGLKFDFRGRLEQMDMLRAWPVAPWRIFLATILPEVVLVTLMLGTAVSVRAIWLGTFHPVVLATVLFQPLVVLTWVALDNAAFLHSPVRYVPGQESALQNVGRAMVLMLLRGIVLLVATGVAVLPGVGVGFLLKYGLETTDGLAIAVGAGVAWLGLIAVDCALVWAGGRMLGRFDVARDRGV